MNYYRFPDTKVFKTVFLLYLLSIHMLTRSSMVANTFLDFMLSQYIVIGLVVLLGIAFLIRNRKQLKQVLTDRRMVAVIGFAVVLIGNMLIKQDWQMLYFSILMYIWFAVLLNYFIPMRELAKYYVQLMVFLSIFAIVGLFILKPMFHAGLIPGFEFDSPGGWHMLNFGLTFTVDRNTENVNALRTFGIFREPGLYQIFLFIAIQLNNYVVEWEKEWKMWVVNGVLFACMLITFATGGVIALALYIAFLFFDKGLYKNRRICIAAAVAVALGIVAIVFALAQNGTWAMELVGMVQKIFEKSDSYTDRVGSIFMDAKIFFQNPLVGEKISYVLHSVPNNTATSPIMFACFGIVGGCLHVASWVALAWDRKRSVIMNLVLLVILFVPFNTQNVIHDICFWIFPVTALLERGLPLLDRIPARKKEQNNG